MKKSQLTFLVASAVLATPLLAQDRGRQDERPDRPDQPSQRPMEAQARTATMPQHFVLKADSFLGCDIRSADGQQIGTVDDLVVGSDGKVVAAVVSLEGEAAAGAEGQVLVPVDQLQKASAAKMAGERSKGDEKLAFTVSDRSALASAEKFEKSMLMDPSFASKLRGAGGAAGRMPGEQPGQQPETTPGAAAGAMGGSTFALVSKLKGTDIQGANDENVGSIENVVIDPEEHRIAFVVLGTGGFLGMGEDAKPLPWQSLQLQREGEDLQITTRLTEDQIAKAPAFDADQWERISDPAWVRQVYQHYGVQPYWSQTREASYRREGATPPGKERGGMGGDEDTDY